MNDLLDKLQDNLAELVNVLDEVNKDLERLNDTSERLLKDLSDEV